MKERTIVSVIVGGFALLAITVASRSTDAIFVVAAIAFFILCIAYAAWCERL